MNRRALNVSPSPISAIVGQHAEESANLWRIRSALVNGAGIGLRELRRLDDRLMAHLDGVAVAGDVGWSLCEDALDGARGGGEVFVATVCAIEGGDAARLDGVLALGEASPSAHQAIFSAFGWVSAQRLKGTIQGALMSASAFRRRIGIAACDLHRADPGVALIAAVSDADPLLRAQALRAIGECGRSDLAEACAGALVDGDATIRFWAARSAVMLGDRYAAVRTLEGLASTPGAHRAPALAIWLKLVTPVQVAAMFNALLDEPSNVRLLIRGVGIAGDVRLLPWLIGQMEDPTLARLAGESLSMMTGLELVPNELSNASPDTAGQGPNEDPDDDIAMDEDDGLPWPDVLRVQSWWSENAAKFHAGERYFMGAPPSRSHCAQVLEDGFQRQRVAAAEYLCLLGAGIRLFPTGAPAWRQQRWLREIAA